MINYKCPFIMSYSVQTGIKHSLGASVFTGYLGQEKAPEHMRETLTAALSRGGGRPVAGRRGAACNVERPRASGSGARGGSGNLTRIPAPCPRGHPE